MVRGSCILLVLCAVFFLEGCGGGGPKTAPVSGQVSFAGKALPEGQIYFVTEGADHPPEILNIKNGEFSGNVTVGTKTIRIVAYKEKPLPKDTPVAEGETSQKVNYIPPKYNANSQLKEEVKEDGGNNFTFNLKKSKT